MDEHPNLSGAVREPAKTQTQLTRHKLPGPIPLRSQPEPGGAVKTFCVDFEGDHCQYALLRS